MEKKVRVFEMHKENGTFYDIYEVCDWLGNISTASIGNKFKIHLEIIETKEENNEEQRDS